MRILNRYVISLVIACCIVIIVISATGSHSIDIFLIAIILAYLVTTTLYYYLNPQSKRAMRPIRFAIIGIAILIGILRTMILF